MHVPIQVTLVEPVTAGELALLERTVGDACRTALQTARREFLDVRGTGRRIVVDRPDPVFTGTRTRHELRELAAKAIATGVAYGVTSSGLLRHSPAPVTRTEAPPAEPFDASRVGEDEGGATYRTPSYDHGGEEVAVRFFHQRADDARPTSLRPVAGRILSLDEAAEVAWSEHLNRHGAVWNPQVHGYPGYAGLIICNGKQVQGLVWVSGVTAINPNGSLPQGSYSRHYQELPLLQWQPAPGGGTGFGRATMSAGPAPYYELVRTGRPATVEEVERFAAEILDAARVPAHHPVRRPGVLRHYAEQILSGANRPMALFEVRGGLHRMFAVMEEATTPSPIRFVTALPPTGPEGGQAGKAPAKPEKKPGPRPTPKAKPATKPTAKGKPKAKDGGAAGVPAPPKEHGKDRRRRPGSGDDEATRARSGTRPRAGAERAWPSSGIRGEQLVCAPYEGEPGLTALPDGGDALARAVRRLSGLLDVDSCGFLGMFTLNCAKVIASRARGVGVSSVDSPVTTRVTVRPDGGGNNGFVDVRAGEATELTSLHVLAEAATLVRELADEVAAAYQLPRNAALLRPHPRRPGPQAASWTLHFLKDVRTALTDSCMHLYAETCRVLLLQQLRSSAPAIKLRSGPHAPETVEHFTAVLDIMGGGVVKLLVLRTAMRHAERVGATGTVREVLSKRETKYRPGYHEYEYEAPAPIGKVDPRTLRELNRARIERRGTVYTAVEGASVWTPEALETDIHRRRALVNQLDPLFFQVEDLEEVFASAQHDPGFTQRYLERLLNEMAAANKEMTRKAKEADSGAFFALEASRFIASGGRDSRGLWFQLSGIHALADDELAPSAGKLREYTEGVNLALGRKAGFEAVKQVFLTGGIIVLGLLCAPLGATIAGILTAAVSVGFALEEAAGAVEIKELYRALVEPETLQQWQDVETAELMAFVGLAFSVFDVAHIAGGVRALAISRSAVEALGVGRRAGVKAGLRALSTQARRTILANTTEQMLKHAMSEAVAGQVVAQVMDELVSRVVGPVVMDWTREQGLLHGTLDKPDAGDK
ncbi:hypothetical protein [Streptomyces sp. NPDC093589]|uniref:hypothetical protein n=1 Tax=Streptomyces sp. NPDC093589 TaxID=3366043 RepID=UPI0038077718